MCKVPFAMKSKILIRSIDYNIGISAILYVKFPPAEIADMVSGFSLDFD